MIQGIAYCATIACVQAALGATIELSYGDLFYTLRSGDKTYQCSQAGTPSWPLFACYEQQSKPAPQQR